MLRAGKALIMDPNSEFSHLLREQLVILQFDPRILAPDALLASGAVWATMSEIHWLFIDLEILLPNLARLLTYPTLHVVVMGWDDAIHDSLKPYTPPLLYLHKARVKSSTAMAQALDHIDP